MFTLKPTTTPAFKRVPSIALCLSLASLVFISGCQKKPSAEPSTEPMAAMDAELFEVRTPKRISKDERSPEELKIPELPKNADSLPELTIEMTAKGGSKRVVSRSKNRVHLAMPDQNQEWLFVRNPVDGRRVTGILIDHKHQVLLDYPETDLRIEGVARGWADVIAFDEHSGKVLKRAIDPLVIADPKKRFPQYGDFDIADWREELHDNGHDHAGHHPTTPPAFMGKPAAAPKAQSHHGHDKGHGHDHSHPNASHKGAEAKPKP